MVIETGQWSPPNWARLLGYLVGIALFAWGSLQKPPNFPLLVLDSVVLIGLSPDVFRQVAGFFGGGNHNKASPPSTESAAPPTTDDGGAR